MVTPPGSAWREPHHTSYDEMMSPSRGPPPPTRRNEYWMPPSSNDSAYPPVGPPPPTRGNEYWMSPPPYSNEYPPQQSRGSYWGPPPTSSMYDGYNRGGGPPPTPGSLRGPPLFQHMPHPSQQQQQHQPRSPSRRGPSYGGGGGEQQVGIEPRIQEHHLFQQRQHGHQRKDFSPPAPAAPVGQSPTTRGVQVTVSASADSEESLRPSIKQVGGRGRSNDAGDNNDDINNNDVIMGNESESVSKQGKKEKGDPLSVLADVSAGMGGKNKQGKQIDIADNIKKSNPDSVPEENATSTSTTNAATASRPPPVPMPAPTSPLQRRTKPSPITPGQTPQENAINSSTKRTPPTGRQHQPITPSRSHESSSTTEGGGGSSQQSLAPPPSWEPPPLPHGDSGIGSGGSGELYSTHHPEYTSTPQQHGGSSGVGSGLYNTPSRRSNISININSRPGGMHYGGGVSDFGPPFPTDSPALVERGSFDSHGDASSYRGQGTPLYPPATPTSSRGGAYSFYDEHPPPPPGYGNSPSGGAGYWDSGPPPPPYSPTYPPPNRGGGGGGWNQSHPPSTHSDPYYGGPTPPPHHLHHGPPPDYPYPPPPPPSHYGGPEDHHDPAMYPPPPSSHGPLFHHRRGGPPPSMLGGPHHHPGMPPMHPLHHMGGPPPSYPYGHPSRMMEEKTILRKKFSWKHYPELERFLIANRDEYLKHSNMNYTAEQKQYNNWLTERLLEMAGQHNYMFDPDDFNFVAIRDRIRCYYKSYVQTARKRGLKLPDKKGVKAKLQAASTSTTEQKKE